MKKMNIGLQLYTLREEMAIDFKGMLKKVAELGYEGVEFAGYGGLPADDLKALLDELGLKGFSSHLSLHALRADLQKEIDYLKAIGAQYMVCPYLFPEDRPKNADEWRTLFVELEQIGKEVQKQGLILGYHNHEFEFEGVVGDNNPFEAMFAETTPQAVQVEMDVCWVQFAGKDPLQYIDKYAGRLPLLHLKDYSLDDQRQMVTLELGEGVVDLPAVIQAGEQAGVEWLIVEQDFCQSPPLQSIEKSYAWLKRNYLT
ncbi:sugar phosphate isomerase/epimerase family protein [Paenibacillus sp. 2TAB26]|uniref:sugar phosphate isomerase/epimerase family protein n=1 Tax=Paenibacillus sp. 2TAB26 TaxID=3233005 RepID=UPI003F9C7207